MSKDKSILEDIENAAKTAVKKAEEVIEDIARDEQPHTVTYDDDDKQPEEKKPESK